MTFNGDMISKHIGRGLVLAVILAYWAPVVSSVSSKVAPFLPVLEASTVASKNTTVAYEVIERPAMADTMN
jgi:hypothetical protein